MFDKRPTDRAGGHSLRSKGIAAKRQFFQLLLGSVIVGHLKTSTLEPALEVEALVHLGTVEDALKAENRGQQGTFTNQTANSPTL